MDDVTRLRGQDRPDDEGEGEKQRAASRSHVRAHDPGAQLRTLKCFEEIEIMLRRGDFVRDVVAFIHAEGELTHLSANAAAKAVMRYKKHLLHGGGVEARDPVEGEAALDEEDPISVIIALRQQFFNMNRRIRMETATEVALAKLFSTTHKEFIASSMLGDKLIRQMKEFDMLTPDAVGGRGQATGATAGPVDIAAMATNPESRHKILGVLNIMIQHPEMLTNVTSLADERKKRKRNRPKRNKGHKNDKAASGDEKA